jgi:hypothetical protein
MIFVFYKIVNIFKKNKKKSDINTPEMDHFYKQLLKMKKKRTHFNCKKVMLKIYPNYIFKDEKKS